MKASDFPSLPRTFYDRHPALVAPDLLGQLLVRENSGQLCGGRIVEVEAYLSQRDSACHANRGPTRKNAAMFGPPGHAYVYSIHARWCLNVVTEPPGTASAILIRAIEPLWGLETMQSRRGLKSVLDLCRGPARLCQSLDVAKTFDGWDLTLGRQLWIAADLTPSTSPISIRKSRRVGVTSAKTRLLRFFIMDSPFVSGARRLNHPRTKLNRSPKH